MTHHVWGDGFDFDGLCDAARWLGKHYFEQTGRNIIWKEKYGTIRYEMFTHWMTCREEQQVFEECLREAIQKFPQFAGELADDFFNPYGKLDGSDSSTQFFQGVTFLHDALNKDTSDGTA